MIRSFSPCFFAILLLSWINKSVSFTVGHSQKKIAVRKEGIQPLTSFNNNDDDYPDDDFYEESKASLLQQLERKADEMFRAQYEDESNVFGMTQRIESAKCLALGALVGSLACAPLAAIHQAYFSQFFTPVLMTTAKAQWEWAVDAAAVQGGLFAVVYRYCVRTDNNPQLGQGVVGAFAFTRTLGGVVMPKYCKPLPLDCGGVLGYIFEPSVIGQLGVLFTESIAIFGAVAFAMNQAMNRDVIKKFP